MAIKISSVNAVFLSIVLSLLFWIWKYMRDGKQEIQKVSTEGWKPHLLTEIERTQVETSITGKETQTNSNTVVREDR